MNAIIEDEGLTEGIKNLMNNWWNSGKVPDEPTKAELASMYKK